MHNCLTLVDYTWRDAEDGEISSPTDGKRSQSSSLFRRRIARSLDENHSERTGISLDDTSLGTRTRSFRSDVTVSSARRPFVSGSERPDSVLLLSNRQRPTYAASRRLSRGPSRVWAPVGHCRYLLDRDPLTGEIQWSPEANEVVCSPRSLTEICMARLVRDWPCVLPPRQPSLRNVVSFLFRARESRESSISSRGLTHPYRLTNRRSVSVSSPLQLCEPPQSAKDSNQESNGRSRESIRPMTYHDLPSNLLNNLIREAIQQRDCAAVTGLVANWPGKQMTIRRLIPPEEFPLSPSYLTKPSFVLVSPETGRGSRTTLVKGPSLMDAFILGLLTRQPVCKLTTLDFTGFEEDRRVSMELSRLPILWMKPENRNSEFVRRHLMASLHIGIPQKRLESYYARITSIYAIHEAQLGHGEEFDAVTIHLDCNMTVDEVALGLALQWLTPFRFSCNRLLLQRLPEIHFPPYSLIRLFDPLSITQFEMEDPSLGSSIAVVLPSAVGWLISLRNLRACSLPACIPPPPDFAPIHPSRTTTNLFHAQSNSQAPTNWTSATTNTNTAPVFTSTAAACRLLNRALISLRHLQRLGLARCHLTGNLKILLNGLSQPLEYLNLQDCCLSPEDVTYLVMHWRPLQGLYELNLSRNNLTHVSDDTLRQLVHTVCLRPPGQLVCLSMAYTSLSIDRLIWLVGLIAGMEPVQFQNEDIRADLDDTGSDKWFDTASTLRVLCIQPFVPPSREAVHRILSRISQLPKLHRLHLFPAAYAFPTEGLMSQRELRNDSISHSRHYLKQRLRPDIEVL